MRANTIRLALRDKLNLTVLAAFYAALIVAFGSGVFSLTDHLCR